MIRLIFTVFLVCFPSVCFADGKLDRCEPYRARVEEILAECGVSHRFYFLMAAESGCASPSVTSEKGARGFWQLMPHTARRFGCHDTQDLDCSTRAAAAYLKNLSERFDHDFQWTIAAYNAGGHNLKRVTGYRKGMKFSEVRKKRPQAFWLAKKVLRLERESNAIN